MTNLEELKVKYMQLMHAVQSGVEYLMQKNENLVSPKSLRVGINSAHVTNAAIAELLIQKGIFTKEEYFQETNKKLEQEIQQYEEELSERFNCKMTLR